MFYFVQLVSDRQICLHTNLSMFYGEAIESLISTKNFSLKALKSLVCFNHSGKLYDGFLGKKKDRDSRKCNSLEFESICFKLQFTGC